MSYPVHTIETAPEAAKDGLRQAEQAYGFVPNLLGVMAEAPAVMKAYPALNQLFDEASFSPSERQTVLLAVSYANGCDYCMAAHTVIAGMQSVPDDVITAVREGTPIADPKLEALRRFTEEVVQSRGWPSDAATQAFFDAGYDRQQVLEVMLGVALKTLSNYVNHQAETPLDPAFSSGKWQKDAA